MDKEYIEREVAIMKLMQDGCSAKNLQSISDIPGADVAPVVHGKWDDSLDGITPYCSICGHSHKLMVRTPNYCPNCGAKMDGGEENAAD